MIRILVFLLAGTSWAGPLRTVVVEAPVVPITGGLSFGAGILGAPGSIQPLLSNAGALPLGAMGVRPSVTAVAKPSALPALEAVGTAVSPGASRQGTPAGTTLTRAFDGMGVRPHAEAGAVSAGDAGPRISRGVLSRGGRIPAAAVKGEPPDQPAPPQLPVPPQPGGPLKPWQIAALVVGGLLVLALIGYLVYDVGVKTAEWLATLEAGLRNSSGDPFGFE